MAVSPCGLCGRMFQMSSLKNHKRICNGKGQDSFEDIYDVVEENTFRSNKNNGQNPGSNFVVCRTCGKTYTVHSIEKHEVICGKKAVQERKEMEAQKRHDEGPKNAGRLPGVVCYICGRNFGTTSIEIHEKNCIEKFQKQNEQLPKNERRQLPVKPQTDKETLEAMVKEKKLGGNSGYDLNAALNDANAKSYNQNLVPCPNCQRTFNADALKFHTKACTRKRPARKVGQETKH